MRRHELAAKAWPIISPPPNNRRDVPRVDHLRAINGDFGGSGREPHRETRRSSATASRNDQPPGSGTAFSLRSQSPASMAAWDIRAAI